MLNANQLKKFIKSLDLEISSVEEEKSTGTDGIEVTNYVLHLVAPIELVKGSQITDQMAPINMPNVDKFRINESDWDAFCKDATEEGDIIKYSGTLKTDVSKPRVDARTGKVVRGREAWLVSIPFNKRRGQLMKQNSDRLSTVMAELFGRVDENNTYHAPTAGGDAGGTGAKAQQPLKVVDTDDGN